MKHLSFGAIFCLLFSSGHAQDFPGFRTGNYAGVNGVFSNPASIADSRYRMDFNLVSASAFIGNNNTTFNFRNLVNSLDSDNLESNVFGTRPGTSSALVSADIHGLSAMFNAGPKWAFAITSRYRVMANTKDMDGKLLDNLDQDNTNSMQLPYTISTEKDMTVNANAWIEIGVSAARSVIEEGPHFLKAGGSLKYVSGFANAYVNVARLNGTINDDPLKQDTYLSNTTGRIETGFGGASISEIQDGVIPELKSKGFGADIGFVYEFRPDYGMYKQDGDGGWKKDMNKYKLRAAVSLLDIGRIKYERDIAKSGSYDMHITGNERFYLSQLADQAIDEYKPFFNSQPEYFSPTGTNDLVHYKVSLPTTLHLSLDYFFKEGIYVNLASQIALVNKENKAYSSRYYNNITLTPRFESRIFGVYVPVNYNALTKFNAGISFRAGPLYFGSGSVITALLGDSRQADVHVGLRFGILQRKTN